MSDMSPTPPSPDSPARLRAARPRSGIAADLREGEAIIQRAIIHPGIYWKSVGIFLIAIVLLLVAFNLGMLFLIVTLISFFTAWLTKHYLLLLLTDQRVVMRFGVLALETVQMHYNRIESVELAWTPMGRILGYATVLVSGTGSRVVATPFVANAQAVRAELDRLISMRDDKPIKVEIENPK